MLVIAYSAPEENWKAVHVTRLPVAVGLLSAGKLAILRSQVMASTPLTQILLIQPSLRSAVLNWPLSNVEALGALPAGTEEQTVAYGRYDWIHVFADNNGELLVGSKSRRPMVRGLNVGGVPE